MGIKEIVKGLFRDENPNPNFRCEFDGVCVEKMVYWDWLHDPELALCSEHGLKVIKVRQKWRIADGVQEREIVQGDKYCHQCQKRYDGDYISHKPNCYKVNRWFNG